MVGVALLALGWVWWRAWSPLVARDAAALCMAGVALGGIELVVSHGRHGTWRHPPAFCVAGVALLALGSLWWPALRGSFVLRGRGGTYGTGLALVARLVPVGRPGRFFHTQIVTHNSFTHSLSHKTLLHTTLSHTAFHTRLFHIQNCHTQPFLVTHSTFTHNSFTHSSITHSSFTQSVFPIPFSHLF